MRRAILAIALLAAVILPNTPVPSQRLRTYDMPPGAPASTGVNDPRGFIACGETVGDWVHRVYVDLYFSARGVTTAGATPIVLLDAVPVPRLWGLTDQGIRFNFGRSQVAVYDQQLTGPGVWTFVFQVGTSGQAVACSITKR